MLRNLVFIFATFLFFGCDELDSVLGRNSKRKMEYSYTCLDSSVGGSSVNRTLEQAGDFIRDMAVSEKTITDSMQTAYGRVFHEDALETGVFKLDNDQKILGTLNEALSRLLEVREDPSGIRYSIYVLKDTTVNAFTFGGRIYITQAMIEKCEGKESLLYAIIGHEIGHSEVGHIKNTIQDMELSNKIFGEKNGATFFQLKKLFTASFNQRNELEADYYGINLTSKLGYDVCTAVAFWKEMASNENQYSEVEDFFRSHPFSELRATCLDNHISNNFNKTCGSIQTKETLPQVVQ
jgi:predicted Zn-dependent protease